MVLTKLYTVGELNEAFKTLLRLVAVSTDMQDMNDVGATPALPGETVLS